MRLCRRSDRAVSSCSSGGSWAKTPGPEATSWVERRTLCFSASARAGSRSPSFTARCTSSQEATCMRRVVRRMLSAA